VKQGLVLLVVMLAAYSPARAGKQSAANEVWDFAAFLNDSRLPALYLEELRNLCTAEQELSACRKYAAFLNQRGRFEDAISFADSVDTVDTEIVSASQLMKAEALFLASRYREAAHLLGEIMAALPPEGSLTEGALLKGKCDFKLGNADRALINLRSLEGRIDASEDPEFALWLGLCEEGAGDQSRARTLLERAWKAGLGEAAVGLMRLSLGEGNIKEVSAISERSARRGMILPSGPACGLAGEIAEVVPGVWHMLLGHALADSTAAAGWPVLVHSVAAMAESGEDVKAYCARLLSSRLPRAAADEVRYARALSPWSADSLSAVFAGIQGPDLKIRCGCAYLAGFKAGDSLEISSELTREIFSMADRLLPEERFALAQIAIGAGKAEFAMPQLIGLAEDLEVGTGDAALASIAYAMEDAGETGTALEIHRAVSNSPSPSIVSLRSEKRAYYIEGISSDEHDLAAEIERIAVGGASLLELGDLFVEKFGDYERASEYYRRAFDDAEDGAGRDIVGLKLAGSLARLWHRDGASESERAEMERLRAEAVGMLTTLAGSEALDPAAIVTTLAATTDFLRLDHEAAAEVVSRLAARDDLGSDDLYRAARVSYYLFIQGRVEAYDQCLALVGRLIGEYTSSTEAGPGALLGAKIRFGAGDYVAALEAYQSCISRWRKPELAELCNLGIGECYLYSGGVARAVTHLKQAGNGAEVLYRIGRCYETLNEPDSAQVYYRRTIAGFSDRLVADGARMCLGLMAVRGGNMEAAMEQVDSAVPFGAPRGRAGRLKTRLGDVRRIVAAFAAAKRGYRDLALDRETAYAKDGGIFACEAGLLAAEIAADSHPDVLSDVLPTEAYCYDIFGAFDLLRQRALAACRSGPQADCREERDRFGKRFPLALGSLYEIDLEKIKRLFHEGDSDTAGVMLDSLLASHETHPADPEALYTKGIDLMIDGAYDLAIGHFASIIERDDVSAFYYDSCFKLGTAYYMIERYDSSAIYFNLASGSDKASVVENAFFNGGLALEKAGDLVGAAELFRTLALTFPFSERFERALMRSGYALENAGRYDQAIHIYRALLAYTDDPEAAAEATYWIGESLSERGDHVAAGVEFMRCGHLYPAVEAWAGTAWYRAGMECELAGLVDHAIIIYENNVRRFGAGSDWGEASADRLIELRGGD
jgi:tetratricopeptide (TPR) repeat protein